jgi:hypothetical protein
MTALAGIVFSLIAVATLAVVVVQVVRYFRRGDGDDNSDVFGPRND